MSFIEFEKSSKNKEWSMNELHSHSHYEIYLLIKGERKFFLSNALYALTDRTLVVIPPFVMHKTEGGAFERYNINVSADYLDAFQKETLDKTAKAIAVHIPQNKMSEIIEILKKTDKLRDGQKNEEYVKRALFSYLILLISELNTKDNIHETIANAISTPPIILKTIEYLNLHYGENINLQTLSERFFLSKTSLCKKFKQATNCTIIDFLLNLRLNKAKHYLSSTDKSVCEISEICGFCSQNYFGLIFKKKVGLSPLSYRKYQRNKQ